MRDSRSLPRFPFRLASGPAGPIARSVRRRADPEAPRSTKDRGATNRGSVACAVPLRRGEGSPPFSHDLVHTTLAPPPRDERHSPPRARASALASSPRLVSTRRGCGRYNAGGSDDAAEEHETPPPTFKDLLKSERRRVRSREGKRGGRFGSRSRFERSLAVIQTNSILDRAASTPYNGVATRCRGGVSLYPAAPTPTPS